MPLHPWPRPRDLIEISRAYLVLTAASDIVAGAGLALGDAGSRGALGRIAAACLASGFIYSFGMVTNDIFDRRRDRERFPHRPIPSGRVSPGRAWAIAAVLLVAGLGTASVIGRSALASGVALVLLVLSYNIGGKHLPVAGSVLMGSCRAANLLLGGAAATGSVDRLLGSTATLAGALFVGAYIAAVTSLSLLEDRPFSTRPFIIRALVLLLFPAAITAWRPTAPTAATAAAWAAILVLGLADAFRFTPGDNTAHPADRFVRRALGGIFFADAGVLFASDRPGGYAILALFVIHVGLTTLWFRCGPRRPVEEDGPTPEV